MENKTITLDFRLHFTKRGVLIALTAFFLVWQPKFLGSETLTLTTYYPAPYGGYASLLTTGKTLLARDGESVGVGTPTPGAKLDIKGLGNTAATFGFGVRNSDNTSAMVVRDDGNVGIGTTNPKLPAPDNEQGNLDVNDVYLRSSGKWASQMGSVQKVCACGGWTGSYGFWQVVPGYDNWTATTCRSVCIVANQGYHLWTAIGCVSAAGYKQGKASPTIPTVKPSPNCGW